MKELLRISQLVLLCMLGLASTAQAKSNAPAPPPNIIIIISDDAGYADFGFSGCKDFKTPNLDSLAAQSTVLTNFYVAASVCSPSRAGLMTGRCVTRIGHEFNPPPKQQDIYGLPQSERIIANYLQQAGYHTAAFGKWHLGCGKGFTPHERGFNHFYGFLAGGRTYLPDGKPQRDAIEEMQRNGKEEPLTKYLTDAISQEAAQHIREQHQAAPSTPLFLYVAYNCPHAPMQAKDGYTEKFSHIKNKKKQTLAAMQASLDEGIGGIIQALRDTGRLDNTLIFFLNDNGAGTYWNFDNAGLRNYKGSLFDGGIKVAGFIHFPTTHPQAKTKTIAAPTSSLDILPTTLALAGIPIPQQLDGTNLASPDVAKTLDTRYLYWRQGQVGVIRNKEWKLILINRKPSLLFHISQDPTERTTVLDQNADIVDTLLPTYIEWDKQNIAQLWGPSQQAGGMERYSPDSPWDDKPQPRNLPAPEKIVPPKNDGE